jgi:hypothetical protein
MLVGTRALESGSRIGQFKGNKQTLFGSEFSGFLNLVFREPITKLTGTAGATGTWMGGFQFHENILPGNIRSVTSRLLKNSKFF